MEDSSPSPSRSIDLASSVHAPSKDPSPVPSPVPSTSKNLPARDVSEFGARPKHPKPSTSRIVEDDEEGDVDVPEPEGGENSSDGETVPKVIMLYLF
jgi:hypothetical protein